MITAPVSIPHMGIIDLPALPPTYHWKAQYFDEDAENFQAATWTLHIVQDTNEILIDQAVNERDLDITTEDYEMSANFLLSRLFETND